MRQQSDNLAEALYRWLGIPLREQPPNHYRLLGLAIFEHSPEVIESAADRQMAHVRAQACGPRSAASQQILNALSSARICLLDERHKAKYDAALRSQLALAQAPTGVAPVAQANPISIRPAEKRPLPQESSELVASPAKPIHQTFAWAGAAIIGVLLFFMVASHFARSVFVPRNDEVVKVASADRPASLKKDEPKDAPPEIETKLPAIDSIQPPTLSPPPNPVPSIVPGPIAEPKPPAIAPAPSSQNVVPENPVPAIAPPPDPQSTVPTIPPPAIAPFGAEQARAHQEAWAKFLGQQVVETDSVGLKLVIIPPGEFEMGMSHEEIDAAIRAAGNATPKFIENLHSQGPRHHVKITKPFFIGMHEVTVGQFRQFVEATNYKTDLARLGKAVGLNKDKWLARRQYDWQKMGQFEPSDDHPVVNIDWNDAVAFCEWLSNREQRAYRLPTEAEWEYACRAGTTTKFFWGDEDGQSSQFMWLTVAGSSALDHPVGQKKPNAFGLCDILGNAFEPCQDWYSPGYYSRSPVEDPRGPESGKNRVVRGLPWGTFARNELPANEGFFKAALLGIRVVREVGDRN